MEEQRSASDDVRAIGDLVVHSQYLIDSDGWDRLTSEVFVDEDGGDVPEADFGFALWRGRAEIDAGFAASMARFEACMHSVTNLHVEVDGDAARARYYVQGWHWVRDAGPEGRPADFLVLGIMRDDLVRRAGGWRIRRRSLTRVGPGVAVGALPPFLAGLGEGDTPREGAEP